MLDSGVFEQAEFDVNIVVDNDIVNYCKVISEDEYPEDFKKLLELHDADFNGITTITRIA